MTSSPDPPLMDLDHDLALHPFVGDGSLCGACGEARNWHGPPPIPDAPNMPPWVLAYAEYEGRYVRLRQFNRDGQQLFNIGAGYPLCDCQPGSDMADCPVRNRYFGPLTGRGLSYRHCWPHCLPQVWPHWGEGSPDRAKALAEYHRHAELLCHRDGLAGEEPDDLPS